ncbi:MAG: LytR/AlgR family response regulator transcription factor [Bacteroidales bacterium]|jgi:two-component system response regulator LytT
MKAVIVEDEFVAARRLEQLIEASGRDIEVVAVLQSVKESVEWFPNNPYPDLVFMDIHLADGDAFVIFEQVEIKCPIIFTTAYDKYALKAFEVNSIDYLLKPITAENLNKALDKLSLFSSADNNSDLVSKIVESIQGMKSPYKKFLLIPSKDKLIPLAVENIAYIHSEFKMAKIICFNGTSYSMDISLDELLRQLNPSLFYRANRQYIVSHSAIKDLSLWFNGKLSVNLSVETPERIIVSRMRNKEFKDWYMNNDV